MTPNPPLGVLLHSIGGLAAASFYIPYKGVKRWPWENFWLVGGIFSWIFAPWIIALFIVPQTLSILREAPLPTLLWTFFFGLLWGIGGLTFGLTMRYLGIALGYAIALGLCAAFGTLIPPIFRGNFSTIASTHGGQITLAGVTLCLLGIAISGRAGISKERELSTEQKQATVREFSFWKGMTVAILCGIMSACMAFALEAGQPIQHIAITRNVPALWTGLPVLVVILAGGFLTNAVWCLILQSKNKTLTAYAAPDIPVMLNLLLCALAGITWYFQFFFYTMGSSQMGTFGFASWSLHMASIIIFSTAWGIALKEWRGTSPRTHIIIALGLLTLIASMLIVGWGTKIQSGSR